MLQEPEGFRFRGLVVQLEAIQNQKAPISEGAEGLSRGTESSSFSRALQANFMAFHASGTAQNLKTRLFFLGAPRTPIFGACRRTSSCCNSVWV